MRNSPVKLRITGTLPLAKFNLYFNLVYNLIILSCDPNFFKLPVWLKSFLKQNGIQLQVRYSLDCHFRAFYACNKKVTWHHVTS